MVLGRARDSQGGAILDEGANIWRNLVKEY